MEACCVATEDAGLLCVHLSSLAPDLSPRLGLMLAWLKIWQDLRPAASASTPTDHLTGLLVCILLLVLPVAPPQVEAGLLWVWPESGLEAILESSNTPLRVAFPEDTETDTWNRPYPWFVRDLPLRYVVDLQLVTAAALVSLYSLWGAARAHRTSF